MSTTLAPTSELEAVNRILRTIGESPVMSLDVTGLLDAENAKSDLHEANRECQTEGWHWNTEVEYPFAPDAEGLIRVPRNCLEIELAETERGSWDLVERYYQGSRVMYDRANHTYTFDRTIRFDWTQFLPFDELPQAARQYITVLAALKFQNRDLMSDTVESYTEADLGRARAMLEAADNRTGNPNIVWDNALTNYIVHGRFYRK